MWAIGGGEEEEREQASFFLLFDQRKKTENESRLCRFAHFSFFSLQLSHSLSLLSMSSFDATPPVPASLAPAIPPGEALAEALGIKHEPSPSKKEAARAFSTTTTTPSTSSQPQQQQQQQPAPPSALFQQASATTQEASQASRELEEQAEAAEAAAREAAALAAAAASATQRHAQLCAASELAQAASELHAARREDFDPRGGPARRREGRRGT